VIQLHAPVTLPQKKNPSLPSKLDIRLTGLTAARISLTRTSGSSTSQLFYYLSYPEEFSALAASTMESGGPRWQLPTYS